MENYNSFPNSPEIPIQPLDNKFLEIGRSGKNDWWRYALGIIIVAACYLLGQFPVDIYGIAKAQQNGHSVKEILDNQEKVLDPNWTGASKEILLTLAMMIFVAGMIGLFFVVRFIHRKKFLSIITSAPKIRWKRFAITAVIWMLLSFAGQFISMAMYPGNCTLVFNLKPFLITLLIAIVFLPIQTWFEEFFFRGYLFQWIGRGTKTALLPIIITGSLFAGAHMFNPEVVAYGVPAMLPAYLMPGIFLAMMCALDEGLESAMGMHFANNLFGTFAVTTSSSALQANTIWVAKEMKPMADNLTLLFSFLILMAILAKTNQWKISKLYR